VVSMVLNYQRSSAFICGSESLGFPRAREGQETARADNLPILPRLCSLERSTTMRTVGDQDTPSACRFDDDNYPLVVFLPVLVAHVIGAAGRAIVKILTAGDIAFRNGLRAFQAWRPIWMASPFVVCTTLVVCGGHSLSPRARDSESHDDIVGPSRRKDKGDPSRVRPNFGGPDNSVGRAGTLAL
jgi:hypothetical protein